MKFEINRQAKPAVAEVGQSKTPVFVMDDFATNLRESLLADPESLDFDEAPTYYPGIRAMLPEDYIVSVTAAMMPIIKQLYSIPNDYVVQYFPSYYSLVTRKPQELSRDQSVPHFDGTQPYRFALVHYLNEGPHGGTAFYRHNPTGLERIMRQDETHFWQAFDEFISVHGTPDAGYITSSTDHFEKIGEIPYQANRLVLYPGNLLHSGSIINDKDINDNPKTGRLTANIFLNFVTP